MGSMSLELLKVIPCNQWTVGAHAGEQCTVLYHCMLPQGRLIINLSSNGSWRVNLQDLENWGQSEG